LLCIFINNIIIITINYNIFCYGTSKVTFKLQGHFIQIITNAHLSFYSKWAAAPWLIFQMRHGWFSYFLMRQTSLAHMKMSQTRNYWMLSALAHFAMRQPSLAQIFWAMRKIGFGCQHIYIYRVSQYSCPFSKAIFYKVKKIQEIWKPQWLL